jgi:hypothetical protein
VRTTLASGEADWGLAAVTCGLRSEIVPGMPPPDPQMLFGESIHDLAEEPTLENVLRYLAASRLLDQAERHPPERKQE